MRELTVELDEPLLYGARQRNSAGREGSTSITERNEWIRPIRYRLAPIVFALGTGVALGVVGFSVLGAVTTSDAVLLLFVCSAASLLGATTAWWTQKRRAASVGSIACTALSGILLAIGSWCSLSLDAGKLTEIEGAGGVFVLSAGLGFILLTLWWAGRVICLAIQMQRARRS